METKLFLTHNHIAYIMLQCNFSGSGDLESLKECIAQAYDRAASNNRKFVFVFNSGQVCYMNPLIAVEFSQWMRSIEHLHQKYLICSYIIINNMIARTGLSLVLKFYSPTKPYNISNSSDDANTQVEQVLRQLKLFG